MAGGGVSTVRKRRGRVSAKQSRCGRQISAWGRGGSSEDAGQENRLWEDKAKGRIKRESRTQVTRLTPKTDLREASGVQEMFSIFIWVTDVWLCSFCENSLS